jgi:hypothetical protein
VDLTCSAAATDAPRVRLTAVEGVLDASGRPTLSRLLRFERAVGADQWSAPGDLTESDRPATRVFPSVAATSSTTGTLFYEHTVDGQRTHVDAILLIDDARGRRSRVKLSDQPTDWLTIKGDMMYSPAQANFGDYISVATDGPRYGAAWTDGRDGRTRIHVRIVEVVSP